MAGRSTGLKVVISGDSRQLDRVFAKVGKGADELGGKVGRASSGIGRALKTAAVVGTAALAGGLVVGLKESVKNFAEAESIAKQTETVLKSTGLAAKVTAADVGNLATSISRMSGIDDEAIQSAENLLLTFTKVRNEVGAGNDIFNRAALTVTDFSVRFGKDLGGSAILVGKALQDPIKGVTALGRAGVQFTEQQKKQIKALVESGNVLGAQKVVLAELETQTKGAAKAAGETFAGKIGKAKVAVGNLSEAIGGRLAPVIADGAEALAGFVDTLATSDRPAKFFDTIGDAASAARDEISGIFDSIGDKRKGGASLGKAIGGSIGDALADVDWSDIGTKISEGVGQAAQVSGDVAKNVSEGIGEALGKVDGRKLLAGLLRVTAEAISALFSPKFWYENFANIFAVVTIAIPFARILKIPGANFLYKLLSKPLFAAIGFLGKGAYSLLKDVGGRAFLGFLAELEKVAPRVAAFLLKVVTSAPGALSRLPGKLKAMGGRAADALIDGIGGIAERVGGFFGRAASAGIKALADKTAAYRTAAGVIARSVIRGVTNFAAGMARAGVTLAEKLISGLVGGIAKGAGAVGRGIRGLIGKVGSAVGAFFGVSGDGIGREIGRKAKDAAPSTAGPAGGGKGSAALMGAGSQLSPIAKVGASFGLRVTSGLRPGAYTSSGNRSHHADGNAIDMGDGVPGPSAAKLKTFRRLKFLWGRQLEELIYTPGGVGVKNGRPFTYTGKVAADHMDHVHAAETTGVSGVTAKIGGAFKRGRDAFTGDGIGTAARAARRAGLSGADLVTAVAIAGPESSYKAGATFIGPRDHSIGFWQINQLAHKGRFGTDQQLKDPDTNARAMVAISSHGKTWQPWAGFTSGAYRGFLDRARAAVVESRSGGGSGDDRPGPASKPDTRNGVAYPTGTTGKIIGTPHAGTHTLGNWQSDNAIDIAVPVGTVAIAVVDGTIVKVKVRPNDNSRFAGTQVTLQGRRNTYFYTHLHEATVKEGQKVKRGDTIGHTGSANGVAHLHFGQKKGDPMKLQGLAPYGSGGSGGSSGGSSGDGMSAPERQASRDVNQLVEKYGNDHPQRGPHGEKRAPSQGFRSLVRKAAELGTAVEDAGVAYEQLDRRFNQSDEDMDTAGGREQRMSELKALRIEKQKQLDSEKKRATVLKKAIKRYEQLLKAGRKLRDSLKGKARAKVVARLKTYEDALTDARAELKALGVDIEDTEMDVDDLDAEIADIPAAAAEKAIVDRGSRASTAVTAAGLTKTLDDDVAALKLVVADAAATYAETVKKYGADSAEAAAASLAVAQATRSLDDTIRDAALQPFRDAISSLEDDLIMAQVDTPDSTADDIAVVQRQLDAARAAYEDAKRRGDSEAIIEFGQQVLSLQGTLATLQQTTTQLQSSIDDLVKTLREQLDFANGVLATENYQLAKSIADIVSGHIVGYGLAPLAGTAGTGVKARY